MPRAIRFPPAAARALRWTFIALAGLILVPVLLTFLIAWLEISISAGPWRDRLGRAATEILGREVKLEGPLVLVPSMRPVLKVGGIRVSNPTGFSSPEFAYLGEAQLRLDLSALFTDVIRVNELSANNVRVQLEQTADGRANWVLEGRKPAAKDRAAESRGFDASRLPGMDIHAVALRNLSVEYLYGANQSRHYFQLDELKAQARKGQPIQVKVRGLVEKQFPYSLEFIGGSVQDLLKPEGTWALTLSFEFVQTALQVQGNLTHGKAGQTIDIVFGLGTEDLSQIERLLQIDLPEVGATALSGRVRWDGPRVTLSDLRGVMGRTTLNGTLAYDRSGVRPALSGTLSLPALDLRPFLGAKRDETKEEPSNLLDTYRELERQTFSLRALTLLDADLTVRVGRWLSLPGDVQDAELSVRLEDGRLRAPVQATIAQVPLRGELSMDGKAEVPTFLLELGAQRTRLGGLALLLAGIPGIEGELGKFAFRVAGHGENLGALTRTVDVRLAIDDSRLSYGNVEGGRPVDFRLNTLDVQLPGGSPLKGRVKGALLGEPFDAQFEATDLPTLARTLRSPLTLSARATGAELKVDGMLAAPQAQSGTDIRFRLSAPRAGDVGRWLGLSEKAQARLRLRGHVRMESDEWRLSDFAFRLGRSTMTGEFARVAIDRQPLIKARLDVEQLDVRELESMLPPRADQPARQGAASAPNTLDLPILPRGIDLSDADIEVRVKRVGMEPEDITDASFVGRIRSGKMEASPFAANIAGTAFSGAVALDLRGQVPEATLWVAANTADVGQLLRNLKVTEDLDARVESLRVQLIGRGSRLGEMLEKSALDANLETGQLTIRDPARKPLVTIGVKTARVVADPGKPVALDLDGTIDQTPVAIRVSTGAVRDFMASGKKVPFSLNAEAAGARLDLTGRMSVPISQREGELELRVAGARLDSLNQLARVELPPWGPWSLGGRFIASQKGYQVPDLALRVGESRLQGNGSYVSGAQRPRIDVALAAPRIQLDDFEFGTWSPFEKKDAKPEKKMTVEELRAKAKEAAAQGQKLLSPQTLRRLDAYLDVQVDEVVSGVDRLGSGKLHAQLAQGKLDFGPAQVNVPGGAALLSASYEPSDRDVAVQVHVDVDRFDYGILARRIKPGTDLEGSFSLRMDLESRAPALDALMAHADGRVDFAVWPRNMRAGIFDLWAVNVFLALVPAVDPAAESKVNCAVGRFNLRNGKLSQDAILLDTSRMRVAGEGQVNFETETLYLRLAAKAKAPQFFSLATPIAVTGKLSDFKIGVAPGGVADTTARLLTSLFVVPVEKLVKGRPPRDGADVCTNALRAAAQK